MIKTVEGHRVMLKEEEVLWVSAANVYVEIATTSQVYTVRAKLYEIEQLMQTFKGIIRVHRSYLVNTDKMERLNAEKSKLFIQDTPIPISKTYRSHFKSLQGKSKVLS